MALLFMDGMDYASDDHAATRGVLLVNPVVAQTPRITGTGNSIRFNVDGQWRSSWSMYGGATTVGMGCAMYISSTSLQTDMLWGIYNPTGTLQVSIGVRSTGTLNVARGAGAQLSDDVPFVLDTWHYLEWKVVIGSGTSGQMILKLDGNQIIDTGGVNTQATTGGAGMLLFLSPSTGCFIDDLVMWNTTGSYNNDFMGDVKVYTLAPDANGDTNNFTASAGSNFECVDETTPNDDTDYVESSTVNHVDRYSYATLTESGNIKGVQAHVYSRKTDAYLRTIKVQCMSNSNLSESPEKYLSDSYKTDYHIYERNPDGDVAWTDATINAATFGAKIHA